MKELNFLCWGLFFTFLVLPLCMMMYLHKRSGQSLDAEMDFVYLYGMGRIFNDRPAAELYNWSVQKKVCTEIRPLKTGEYGPIPYHPYVGLLFRPFARLPYLAAYLLWTVVSVVLYLAGIAGVSNCCFPGEPLRLSLIFCFGLSFYPFWWTIMTGHLPALGVCAMATVLVQEDRRRPLLSGLALSLCVYKPTLLVLILPMLVVTRRFRTLMGFAAGAGGLAVFATALQGIDLWPGYLQMLFSFGRGAARVQTHTFKEVWKYVDASSVSSSIAAKLPTGMSGMALAGLLGCAVCAGLWLAWTWWTSRGMEKQAQRLVWATTLTWTLVLNVYVPIYDCIQVVLALIVTAGVLRAIPEWRGRRFFTPVWVLIFASSWVTTGVAQRTGFQLITVCLVALGVIQLTAFRKLASAKA